MENRFVTIINLSRKAFGEYKWQILLLTVLGFWGGLLEGVGINSLIPLFAFAGGGDRGTDFISKAIEKFFLLLRVDFNLGSLLFFMISLFALKAFVLILIAYVTAKITSNYEKDVRNRLFRSTLRAEWPYLLQQKMGHLQTILITNVRFGVVMLNTVGSMMVTAASLVVYVLVAVNISFSITLITLVLGGIFFLVLKPLLYRVRRFSHQIENFNRNISHFVNENILGMKTVKSMEVDSRIARIGNSFFDKLREIRVKISLLKSITSSLVEPFSLIFISIVFVVSYKSSGFNLAVLVAVIYLIHRIFIYIQRAQGNLQTINESYPYLKNILDLEEENMAHEEKHASGKPFKFNKSMDFKDITFAYGVKRDLLSGVNFQIKKGEMVGLIGPSGAGKTTIVDLFLRLFEPQEGQILLDGVDISTISLTNWRNKIGYVSQDMYLINDTIENNISFYDKNISFEQIKKAAKMAGVYDFIETCPDKFSTIIGDRGILLSVGQRQRIVIARILARKPDILILDEATSALDNESEIKIQRVIERLKGKITVFIIAHRLSTLGNVDKLLVLDKGKIVEQGNPQDLLKDKQSYFHKVYNIRQ